MGKVLKNTLLDEVETVRRFEIENITPYNESCYGITIDDYYDKQALKSK